MSPPPPAPAHGLRDLRALLLHPDRYFRQLPPRLSPGVALAILFVVGAAAAVEQAMSMFVRGKLAAPTWTHFGASALAITAFAAPVRWFLGALWYRARLRLCGVRPAGGDQRPEALYGIAELVASVPALGVVALNALLEPSPAAVWSPTAGAPAAWSVIFFQYWAVVVGYWGARSVYQLPRRRAAIWFLAVPMAFVTILLARVFARMLGALWGSLPG